ncbi:cholesterol 7-desaturase [Spodoptera litura]|uniref:cholesterol 7-desaturase n=1 Tax=Spodoptera litura TaxID=69820 RepID=A0A9J7EPR1_SPOLT|nr:cholesterol 7-desaturase [Spodoptera litura]
MESCSQMTDDVLDKYLHSDCQNGFTKQHVKEMIVSYLNLTFAFTLTVLELIYEYSSYILLAVALYFLLLILYRSYVNPIIFKKEFTEIGFEHIPPGPDRDRIISRAQTAKKIGSKTPPPFPNGWFAVAESRELKNGGVLSIDALGQNLCIYRGEDGVARVVDAYCPHLGANLGIAGTVSGSCIECPFHKWRFGENGACVSVPGVEHAPKGVSIKHWTTVERDGAVWIWYDAEGRDPLWVVPELPELKSWGYRGRNEYVVSAHIQEIPENGADVAHLNAVHTMSLLSGLGEKYPLLNDLIGCHVWSATWTRNEDHTATMTLTHDYKIMKFDLGHVDVKVTQIGPGHVRLFLSTPVGPILVSQSVTPLGPNLQKVIHRMFSPTYNAPFAALSVKAEGAMFERDIVIWNSKRFVSAPAYVKTDKTIRAFRNWFAQFYSENSIPFREALQNPLDW